MLHNKKDTFEQLVLRTSEYLGVKAEIVEKDYFVTLFSEKNRRCYAGYCFQRRHVIVKVLSYYKAFFRGY